MLALYGYKPPEVFSEIDPKIDEILITADLFIPIAVSLLISAACFNKGNRDWNRNSLFL